MGIPWEVALAYITGLIALGVVGYALLVPMRFLWRAAAGSVLGIIALCAVNLFGAYFSVHIAINPFTALTVGILGLPGAALIVALTLFM